MNEGVTLIAIDWGTTAARAYALDGTGRIIAERSAPLGISQVGADSFAAAFARLLGDWASLQVPRIASGMIGSRQGWIEVPYLECPAALHALATGLCCTPGGEMDIVPGVICEDGAGVPDVMRGEETQILGAIDPDRGDQIVLLPGTHSKWAHVERGHIQEFATWMTGELFAVLLHYSLLGRLAAHGGETVSKHDDETFDRGVRRGLAEAGLSHAIFGARTLALTGDLEPDSIGDWLSGVLIGHEIATAKARFRDLVSGSISLQIVGNSDLTSRYERALGQAGIAASAGPADAAPRGLFRIACQARLIG